MKSRSGNQNSQDQSLSSFQTEGTEMDWLLRLMDLKNSKTFCDVIISKGTTFIYAHSCILAAFSPFMMELLRNLSTTEWSVSKPLKINLTYVTKCKKNSELNCVSCVAKVVDFLYTGKILLEYTHVHHLINLSKIWELFNLLSACQKFAKSKSDLNMSDPVLQEKKRNFLDENLLLKDTQSGNITPSVNSLKVNCQNTNENKLKTCAKENIACVEIKEQLINENNDPLEKRTNVIQANCGPKRNSDAYEEARGNSDLSKLEDISSGVNNDQKSGEYYCIKCKLRFASFKMFESHKKVFHKRQFICLSCNFTTFKLSYIVYHLMNMNHEEDCCSVCLFKAQDSNSLKLHLLDHKNDFPFKCYDCGNLFKARTEWLRHMLVHNVKESFLCKECGSSFLSISSLNAHMSGHKNNSNFVCEVCGFVAAYKSVLERHALKHNILSKTFTCPVIPCPFSTYSKYNLKQHMISHDVEKCFTCEICSLKFSQEKNLKRHVRTLHSSQEDLYTCSRCDFKSTRIDKAKGHCNSLHPNDDEALNFILKQHENKKCANTCNSSEKAKKVVAVNSDKTEEDNLALDLTKREDDSGSSMGKDNNTNVDKADEEKNSEVDKDVEIKKTYILSETTGEFNIISEKEGEAISVASVTSTNVLTIGNFREGTGSVTLNEATGILTFNNINSESTGAVFLNESTGELSYINLSKDPLPMEVEKNETTSYREVTTQLNEFTGEIFTVDNEKKISDLNEEDSLFDSFDMDIGNDDSCDGFDDIDGLLFDPIDIENSEHIDLFISRNEREPLKSIPHLNEATGELSFDLIDSQNSNSDIWNSNCTFGESIDLEEETEDSYRLLLNEVTGEFS